MIKNLTEDRTAGIKKQMIEGFEKENLGFKIIQAETHGLVLNLVIKEEDKKRYEENLPSIGELPSIVIAPRANPGTKQIVPVEWVSEKGKLLRVFGSIIYLNANGKFTRKPGVMISLKEKR